MIFIYYIEKEQFFYVVSFYFSEFLSLLLSRDVGFYRQADDHPLGCICSTLLSLTNGISIGNHFSHLEIYSSSNLLQPLSMSMSTVHMSRVPFDWWDDFGKDVKIIIFAKNISIVHSSGRLRVKKGRKGTGRDNQVSLAGNGGSYLCYLSPTMSTNSFIKPIQPDKQMMDVFAPKCISDFSLL